MASEWTPDQDKDTNSLNRMKGMWVVLLAVLVVALYGGWHFLNRMDQNVIRIAESTNNLDKVVAAYIAENNVKTRAMQQMLDDHEDRLRNLEKLQR